MSYIYIRSEPGLWTVGFYDPTGKFHPESDATDRQEAAERVHWLNGGAERQERTEEWDPGQTRPCPGHQWNMSAGEADENNVSGEGEQVIRCNLCGANGDA